MKRSEYLNNDLQGLVVWGELLGNPGGVQEPLAVRLMQNPYMLSVSNQTYTSREIWLYYKWLERNVCLLSCKEQTEKAKL